MADTVADAVAVAGPASTAVGLPVTASPAVAPDNSRGVAPGEFRGMLRHFPAGVTVVTTATGDGPAGLTVSAFCSLSLTPPLVLVCLNAASRTLAEIGMCRRFGVNILRADQGARAMVFASARHGAGERFQDVPLLAGYDVPVFADAVAWGTCDVEATYGGGDHVILIGLVTATGGGDGPPLVWYDGSFAVVVPT